MSKYSNSPLGLVLTSESTDKQVVGKYSLLSGSASGISGQSLYNSIFGNPNFKSSQFVGKNVISSYDDIKTSSIIEYLQKNTATYVSYSDFSYLTHLGVYPNNRLIIARRFNAGVGDDLTMVNKNGSETINSTPVSPIATLISWVPDNTEFINTEFGENWEEGEASFKDILNSIGKDIFASDNRGAQLGNFLGGGAGIVPLPGFTEGLQYQLFRSLGLSTIQSNQLPIGNPNLIRQSKMRRLLEKDGRGSGLNCKFKIKMTVEYEQKFINGIDPTIVYYDIIANALTFGTSESQFQFRADSPITNKFTQFINDISSGNNARVKNALITFISALTSVIQNVADSISNFFRKSDGTRGINLSEKVTDASNFIKNLGLQTISSVVAKYKVRILSVVNSLTGSPSAPWHVTIGNPRSPIFSSGDMLVENITFSFGKVLAYNDLPSSIKLEFTLESARNLGAQEIFTKFNCGKERTYINVSKSFVETEITVSQSTLDQAQQNIISNSVSSDAVFNYTDVPTGGSSNSFAQQNGQKVYSNTPISKLNGVVYSSSMIPNTNPVAYQITASSTIPFKINGQSQNVVTDFLPDGKVNFKDTNGKILKTGSWKLSNLQGGSQTMIITSSDNSINAASYVDGTGTTKIIQS